MMVGREMLRVNECVPPYLPPANIDYSIAQLEADVRWNPLNIHRDGWYKVFLTFAGLSIKRFRSFLVITVKKYTWDI